jgi:hypothetical protein
MKEEISISMTFEPGLVADVLEHAKPRGETFEAFILRAIQETMRNDKRKGIVLDGEGTPWVKDYLKEE